MTRTRKVVLAGALALVAGAAFVALRGVEYRLALLEPPRVQADASKIAPVAVEEITFEDGLGRKLHAWYHVGTRGHLVLAHGYGASRDQLAPEMKLLAARGIGFLAYDAPGHGASEGRVTWGDREQDAFTAAVDALLARPGVDAARVGALGFSLGGATVLLAAARDLRVKAVIVLGTFSSLHDEIRSDCGRWDALCAWPGRLAMEWKGIPVGAIRPVDAAPRIAPRPLLVVVDTLTPFDRAMQRENYDAAGAPKTLYEVPNALHGDYLSVDPDGYTRALDGFLDRAFPACAGTPADSTCPP